MECVYFVRLGSWGLVCPRVKSGGGGKCGRTGEVWCQWRRTWGVGQLLGRVRLWGQVLGWQLGRGCLAGASGAGYGYRAGGCGNGCAAAAVVSQGSVGRWSEGGGKGGYGIGPCKAVTRGGCQGFGVGSCARTCMTACCAACCTMAVALGPAPPYRVAGSTPAEVSPVIAGMLDVAGPDGASEVPVASDALEKALGWDAITAVSVDDDVEVGTLGWDAIPAVSEDDDVEVGAVGPGGAGREGSVFRWVRSRAATAVLRPEVERPRARHRSIMSRFLAWSKSIARKALVLAAAIVKSLGLAAGL